MIENTNRRYQRNRRQEFFEGQTLDLRGCIHNEDVDLNDASVLRFYYQTEGGAQSFFTATAGSKQRLDYTMNHTETTVGGWSVQGYAEIGTAKYWGKKARFNIQPNLS